MKEKDQDILNNLLVVINLGLRGFAESMEQQDVEVTQIDWTPPAGGDQEMIDLLEELL